MRNAKFLDIIKSLGGYLRVDNKAGYKETYTIDDLGDNDFITKGLVVSGGISGSNVFYESGTALPITMVNGVDFATNALRPIVNMTVAESDTVDTNSGYAPVLVRYNFTDEDKDTLASITILDNGTGSLEFDSWFRVV